MGRDKSQLIVNDMPLWRRQLAVLRETNPVEMLISGPEDGPFADAGCAIIPDRTTGQGPLAGIASALDVCAGDVLLVLAVDMPRMESGYLQRMLAESEGGGIIPVNTEGEWEPLAAIYPKAAAPFAAELLRAGERRMRVFVAELEKRGLARRKVIERDEEYYFENWNSPGDINGERVS